MKARRTTTARLAVSFSEVVEDVNDTDETIKLAELVPLKKEKEEKTTSAAKPSKDPITAIFTNETLSASDKADKLVLLLKDAESLASLQLPESTKAALFSSKNTLELAFRTYLEKQYGEFSYNGSRPYDFVYIDIYTIFNDGNQGRYQLDHFQKAELGGVLIPARNGLLGKGAYALISFLNTPSALRDVFTNESDIQKVEMFRPRPVTSNKHIEFILNHIPLDYFKSVNQLSQEKAEKEARERAQAKSVRLDGGLPWGLGFAISEPKFAGDSDEDEDDDYASHYRPSW